MKGNAGVQRIGGIRGCQPPQKAGANCFKPYPQTADGIVTFAQYRDRQPGSIVVPTGKEKPDSMFNTRQEKLEGVCDNRSGEACSRII